MMNLTVKELRGLAKDNGLKGYSKLRKAELIELLNTNGVLLETNSTNTEQEEDVIIDDYTVDSTGWTDEKLAKYLGLEEESDNEVYDNKLGIHVTPEMINEEELDDEDIVSSDVVENKTFEDIMNAWSKDEATIQEEVEQPRTYAEIVADKVEDDEEALDNRIEAKDKKDVEFYNENSKKIIAENIGNTHIVSGGQAKYLQDLFLNYKITIKDDIYTAEKASEKLNAINTALANGKLTKRKSTVLCKNRPTVAQLQTIINKQGFINVMELPTTKATASKLISNLNKKEFLNKKQVEREVAVSAVNEKVNTLTTAKKSDEGRFKKAIKKFFNRLFN